MALFVDSFNLFFKMRSLKGNLVTNFFKYVYNINRKRRQYPIIFLFDSKPTVKMAIDPHYKEGRGWDFMREDPSVKKIKNLIRMIPNCTLAEADGYEADDLALTLGASKPGSTFISNDSDWLYLLAKVPGARIHRGKTVLTAENFEETYGFPVTKIPLYLFLIGDSKDDVAKPFRLKGSQDENLKAFPSFEAYAEASQMDLSVFEKYLRLRFPQHVVHPVVEEGARSPYTRVALDVLGIPEYNLMGIELQEPKLFT